MRENGDMAGRAGGFVDLALEEVRRLEYIVDCEEPWSTCDHVRSAAEWPCVQQHVQLPLFAHLTFSTSCRVSFKIQPVPDS